MWIRKRRPWTMPESQLTPESVYLNRRQILVTAGLSLAGGPLAALRAQPAGDSRGPTAYPDRPTRDLYPARRNSAYQLDRDQTEEKVAATHNVFDEFSLKRNEVWQTIGAFETVPWRIHIGGQVDQAITIDVDDLIRKMGIEERAYRHRCVETWAMAVPWSGFPLARLVAFAKPRSTARYLRMISAHLPEQMPGWYVGRRVFPYYEALSLEEANNELAFLATGIYGHPLPEQHGAPLRLVVPWKWGLKSLKSIVAFQFTAERPGTFWNDLSPDKYSWESNVDPVGFTAWPQGTETMLGTMEKRETSPYNGYAEQVAHLYRD